MANIQPAPSERDIDSIKDTLRDAAYGPGREAAPEPDSLMAEMDEWVISQHADQISGKNHAEGVNEIDSKYGQMRYRAWLDSQGASPPPAAPAAAKYYPSESQAHDFEFER